MENGNAASSVVWLSYSTQAIQMNSIVSMFYSRSTICCEVELLNCTCPCETAQERQSAWHTIYQVISQNTQCVFACAFTCVFVITCTYGCKSRNIRASHNPTISSLSPLILHTCAWACVKSVLFVRTSIAGLTKGLLRPINQMETTMIEGELKPEIG